jgi:two-component system chemotaxis response regulator CheV
MAIDNSIEQMTQAHLRNVQQLAVFYTGHDDMYAVNIAKVKTFIITDEVAINDTPSDSDIIAGIATIRKEPVTLVYLDAWLGMKPLDIKDYQLIIYCEFNHKKIGFLIKDMLDIVEKTTDELQNSEEQNAKITYTTYVQVDGKDELCTIFNAEQLLRDIGWTDNGEEDLLKYVDHKIKSDKMILAAEDSAVAREVLEKFFIKIGVKYEICKNGAELISEFDRIGSDNIGMVVTDIEMPDTDGYQVAQFIKESSARSHIPVVVNSSMTTEAVRSKMNNIGVDEFVGKTDIPGLYEIVKKYLEK